MKLASLAACLALVGCTYDYQGALSGAGSTSSSGGGGAPGTSSSHASSSHASTSSSGSGAAGGAGGAATSTSSMASSTASSTSSSTTVTTATTSVTTTTSTGGPVSCTQHGAFYLAANSTAGGHIAWGGCPSGETIISGLRSPDTKSACVDVPGGDQSNWLTATYIFTLPSDAVVTSLSMTVNRETSSDGRIQDNRVDFVRGSNFTCGGSTNCCSGQLGGSPWGSQGSFQQVSYSCPDTSGFSPSDVNSLGVIFQVRNIDSTTSHDAIARVDDIDPVATFTTSQGCP